MTKTELKKILEKIVEEEADFLLPLLAQEGLDMTKNLIESNKHISGKGKKEKLSPKYKKQKKKDGYGSEPILKRTGALLDSLYASVIKKGKKRTIEINSDLEVGKGENLFNLHQHGTKHMPIRKITNEDPAVTYDWEKKLNKKYNQLLMQRVRERAAPFVKKFKKGR